MIDRANRRHLIFALLAILVLALVLRAAYVSLFVGWDSPATFDGLTYRHIAQSLIAGEGFASGDQATAFRPPGYPAFLAALMFLFGSSTAVPRAANVLLGALLVAPTAVIAQRIFKNARVALLAALGVALHPVLIYLVGLVYPETLELALLLALLTILYLGRATFTVWNALLAGMLHGALIVARPPMLFFIPVVLLWFYIQHWAVARVLRISAIFLLLIALPIVGWTMRNWIEFREFIPLATEGGVTFWSGNHPLGHGGNVEPSPATWQGENPPANLSGWPGLSEKQSEARFYDAAFEWIGQHPGEFVALLPLKLLRGSTLDFGNEARAGAIPTWVNVAYAALQLVALVGIVLAWGYRRDLLLCYGVLLASVLSTLIFYGSTRQTSLSLPVLILFVVYVVERIWNAMMSRPHARQAMSVRNVKQTRPSELSESPEA